MEIKRKLVLVNQRQYNVYIFTVLAIALMICLTIASVFMEQTREALPANLMFIFGLAVRYVKFKKADNVEEDELDEIDHERIAQMIPQRTLKHIIEKHSPNSSNSNIDQTSQSRSSRSLSRSTSSLSLSKKSE